MTTQENLLAMFPLGICLLPGEKMSLHIFESRYKQLINDCENEGIQFGIPYTNGSTISPHGAVVKVNKIVNRYDNGEMDIEVEAVNTFTITEFFKELPVKLYSGAMVHVSERDQNDENPKLSKKVGELFCKLKKVSSTGIDNSKWQAFQLARLLDLTKDEKYELIALTSEKARLQFLKNKLTIDTYLQDMEVELGERYLLN